MVRALLEGRKTQTRRVLKPQPPRFDHYGRDIMDWGLSGIYQDDENDGTIRWWLDVQTDVDDNSHREFKVLAGVGDRLWVREALDLGDHKYVISHCTYAAGGGDVDLRPDGAAAWAGAYKRRHVPSIHMPRWASRLTLTVTDVRVQRLTEISDEDAEAEGVTPGFGGGPIVEDFLCLWNSIHGPFACNANPWIAAYTFTVERRNIDAPLPKLAERG
jgi:hypothetical protein